MEPWDLAGLSGCLTLLPISCSEGDILQPLNEIIDWHSPLRFEPIYVRHRGRCKSRIDPDSYLHGRDNWTQESKLFVMMRVLLLDCRRLLPPCASTRQPLWLELMARSNTEALAARKSYD